MKPVNQSKALFRGAFILTISALITKILSAFYRIPYQNIVGDVGFYIYQQIYPFYGMAVVLSTTGFPVVISKLFAEQQQGDAERNRVLLLVSYLFLQLFGFLCFLVLFFGASLIASLMKDPHLSILLRVVSLVFLTFPFVSVLRGYYQGKGDMVPTAFSQVGEQGTRVLTIIVLSYIFTKAGYSLYFVGGGAMFGSVTGSILSAIILFTFISIRKEWKLILPKKGMMKKYSRETKWIIKAIVFQGLTICISGMLMVFIQMADALNLYSLLVSSGENRTLAKSLKGVFDRGQPLIQLGTVAATSMSLSLVPLISSGRVKESSADLQNKIKAAIKISAVIAAGASVGLSAIIRPTNIMLFENGSGSSVLEMLSYVILFTSLISTVVAIMQGLGQPLFPAGAIILSFPIKYILNELLVPRYGTMGAAISTVLTLAVITLILASRLKQKNALGLPSGKFILTLSGAVLGMILVLKAYLFCIQFLLGTHISNRLGSAFEALSSAILGGFIYLLIIVRGGIFPANDLSLLPFGSKLLLFLPQKDRRVSYDEKN